MLYKVICAIVGWTVGVAICGVIAGIAIAIVDAAGYRFIPRGAGWFILPLVVAEVCRQVLWGFVKPFAVREKCDCAWMMNEVVQNPERPSAIPQVICIAMLTWALVPVNPYGYYIILRFVICGVCAFLAFKASEEQRLGWAWALGITAVVYNPIIPVHLTREIWSVVNIATIALLGVSIAVLNGMRRAEHGEVTRTLP